MIFEGSSLEDDDIMHWTLNCPIVELIANDLLFFIA